uniref:Oxidoreductase FAD/NAD(P)-binding domain-containing protein n=1 Tax=Cyclopterus lumpus TaxID=8103 RepID=A0A8C3AST6_CYCLU
MATIDFFVEQVQVEMCTKFQVNQSLLAKSVGFLPQGGAIETFRNVSKLPNKVRCYLSSQCTVGGDFDFNPAPSDPSVDLLLVAGGVGINPSYSTLLHTASLLHLNQASGGRDYKIGSAHLCYSAKNTQELLFKSSIIKACGEFPDKLSCDLHVTQQSTDVDLHLQPFINHKITEEELQAHVDPQRTLCFLCGPRPMIEALSKTLMDFGLPKDRILFEKWW